MISKLSKNKPRRNFGGHTWKGRLRTNPASEIQSPQKPTSAPELDSLYGMIKSGRLGVYKIMAGRVEESKIRNHWRPAKDSALEGPRLALILSSVAAHGLTTTNELAPLAETERRAIINALHETRGNKVAASRILRIGRTTLYRKLKKYIQTGNFETGDSR